MEKMKNRNLLKQQDSLTSRTTIEAEILFAVCLSKCGFWSESVKTPPKKSPCSKKIGAVLVQQADRRSFEASAVPILVYFYIIMINKYRQSAKRLLLNSPTDRTFENRWSRYKEPSKNKAEAYLVYVEHLFLRSDAGDARIFSKEKDVYGTDYGFGLEAPKETEQANPQDLFAYRRNYTWNERNLLTKSSDRNFTVHYRYGDDGQRALKYTDEGRSETLYFNNFFTIHIPTQDQNNPQGLRVHKHIFVGNSRLVTAMTHTDNSGDNEEQKAKRYYYHADHLQSAQFVTDWKGRQYEHIEYTPYGELWIEEVAAGLDKLPFRFTGKEMDEETGLYYYGARYLDPKYSRWLSGDPALGEYIPQAPINDEAKKHNENLPDMGGVFNTVNLHVYHYAGNNPIKYIDPDGETFIDDAINFLKGWINYEVDKGQSLFTNNTSFVPDPTYEAFNDILRSIDNFSKAAFQDHKFIDKSIGKSGSDDEFLKAMYVASGADLRITQGQFNLNGEIGVVNAEGLLNIHNHEGSNWGISLSGGASSFTGETALGLKDSSLTASIGASMLEYKGAINLKIGDMKVRLKGSFFIGGLGAGASLGPRIEFKFATGIGGSLGLEFRKIEE